MTLLTILKSGDNIIVPTGLYGGTLDLFRDLEGFGVTTIFVDPYTPEEIDGHVTERTRALFTEFVGNPKLNVADVRSLSAFAKEKKLPLIVDSTTMTPAVVNPLRLGADIVIHSSSKYINGGGNAISGIIVDGGTFQWDDDRYDVFGTYRKFKKGAFTARLRNSIWRDIGACLSPVNAFLNLEGIETLSLRMERICDNALALAQMFSEMEEISVVNYPGLPDNPYQQLVQEELGGRAGGILTIRVGSKERAFSIINHLKYAINASNIGDTKTLVVHPASTIFVHSTEEEKQAAGVYEDLIRISVGIEYIEDIKEDFRQAIAAAFAEEQK
jgi:O-acetylhomoserine (thiol)-lyase